LPNMGRRRPSSASHGPKVKNSPDSICAAREEDARWAPVQSGMLIEGFYGQPWRKEGRIYQWQRWLKADWLCGMTVRAGKCRKRSGRSDCGEAGGRGGRCCRRTSLAQVAVDQSVRAKRMQCFTSKRIGRMM
jgi:hypothetical protein